MCHWHFAWGNQAISVSLLCPSVSYSVGLNSIHGHELDVFDLKKTSTVHVTGVSDGGRKLVTLNDMYVSAASIPISACGTRSGRCGGGVCVCVCVCGGEGGGGNVRARACISCIHFLKPEVLCGLHLLFHSPFTFRPAQTCYAGLHSKWGNSDLPEEAKATLFPLARRCTDDHDFTRQAVFFVHAMPPIPAGQAGDTGGNDAPNDDGSLKLFAAAIEGEELIYSGTCVSTYTTLLLRVYARPFTKNERTVAPFYASWRCMCC